MKNNRRILSVVIALQALLVLTGCSGTVSLEDTVGRKRPAMLIAESYEPYVIPWYLDAPEKAEKAGTLDFYFMSTNNMPFKEDSEAPGKWGDSCLVVFPNGETMLIDGGDGGYEDLLLQNLTYLGVEKVDHVVLTHPHSDHCWAILKSGGLMDTMEIGHVYHNGMYNTGWGSNVRIIEQRTQEKGIPLTVWKAGDAMEIGGVSLEVLGPDAECAGRETDVTATLNDNSLLIRFDYGEFSALFTGDLYTKAEVEYVMEIPEKLDVDLLKVPHHGRETSSSGAFIKAVTPEVAVATGSVAMKPDVYKAYTKRDVKVYLDYCDGYICVSSDGAEMSVVTSHERNTDIYNKYDK